MKLDLEEVLKKLAEKRGGSTSTPEAESEPEYDGLDACAEDLIEAIEKKNVQGVKAALRNAFTVLSSSTDEE